MMEGMSIYDAQNLGRAIGQGIAEANGGGSAAGGSSGGGILAALGNAAGAVSGPISGPVEQLLAFNKSSNIGQFASKWANAGSDNAVGTAVENLKSNRWNDKAAAQEAAANDLYSPAVSNYQGYYGGSNGLQAYMSGDYNFQLSVRHPNYKDMVQLDMFFSLYGISVNEFRDFNFISSDLKSSEFKKKYYYIKTGTTNIKSSVRNAQEQAIAMFQQGVRFWDPDANIGDAFVDDIARFNPNHALDNRIKPD